MEQMVWFQILSYILLKEQNASETGNNPFGLSFIK